MSGRQRVDVGLAAPASLDADELRRCEALLGPDERARADRLLVPGARRLHVATRALLRTTLSRHADVAPDAWRFRADANGKPHVTEPSHGSDLRFSLSHTDGLVAVAVTTGCDLGIDVERVDLEADIPALGAIVLAPHEQAALDAAAVFGRAETFFAFWTLKEAYLKALGSGLSESPERVAFDLEGEAPTARFAAPAGRPDWSFRRMAPTDDHILALAVASPAVEVEVAWRRPSGDFRPPSGLPRHPPLAGTPSWRRAS